MLEVFVRISATQDPPATLEERDDFGRFHVEVSGLDREGLGLALERHRLGRLTEDPDHVDLRAKVVESLADTTSQAWRQQFDAMLDYARSAGWMPDEVHIRAHCVWVGC
jgi:hypothetical protein